MLDAFSVAGLWQNSPFTLSVFTSMRGRFFIPVFRGGDGFPPHVLAEGSLGAVPSRISRARTTEVGNEKRNIN